MTLGGIAAITHFESFLDFAYGGAVVV